MPIKDQEPTTRPLINKSDVARQARVSPSTVECLIRQGVLPEPVFRAGRVVRFDPVAIDKALRGGAQ